MPAISTSTSSLVAAATALASAASSAAPSQPKPVDIALVLKIVIPLGVLAILGVVGLIVWLCRTPDYDENAPTNLRKKTLEEDPAPAYEAEVVPPTYFVPADSQADRVDSARSEEAKAEEAVEEGRGTTTAATAAGRAGAGRASWGATMRRGLQAFGGASVV